MKINNELEKLYEKVLVAYNNAYAPYSKFQVGAAIELTNGEIITGANVENASYGLCNCAERSALFAAYSKGVRKEDITKMMIIAKPITATIRHGKSPAKLKPAEFRISTLGTFKDPIITPIRNAIVIFS